MFGFIFQRNSDKSETKELCILRTYTVVMDRFEFFVNTGLLTIKSLKNNIEHQILQRARKNSVNRIYNLKK